MNQTFKNMFVQLTLAALIGLTLATTATVAQADDQRPNILFIIADDASRDSFGAYGCEYIKTPAFDEIAKRGVLFTQAYACNPKCAAARACLLTGRHSWQLEEACNHNPFLSEKWKFYPYLLEEQGYHVGFTGKGWGPGDWHGARSTNASDVDNPAGHPYSKQKVKPPFSGISTYDYAENFRDFLDANTGGAPFCFWMGVKEPHRAYQLGSWKVQGRDLSKVTVPAYFPDNETIRGDLADYAIEVEWFDQHIARAVDHLKATDKLHNTIIVVTSDHGMPFPRVKGQVYDAGFRVPFAVRWDARIQPEREVTDFITFADLAPTFLKIAGVDRHQQMTGTSFLPQLESSKGGRIDPSRNFTLLGKERHDIGRTDGDMLSVGYPVRAIRNDQFLYVRNFQPQRWPAGNPELGLRNTDGSPTKSFLVGLSKDAPEFRFYQQSFGKRPQEELYDVIADPDCVQNLAGDQAHSQTRTELWQKLERELTAQGDPRIFGNGAIFDFYPNSSIAAQRKLYKDPTYDPVKLFEKFLKEQSSK